jgi:hypothetical protein
MDPIRDLEKYLGVKMFGYHVYHYSKGLPYYYLLLDDQGNPVGPLSMQGHTYNYFPERATIDQAWEDCPKFGESLPACQLLLDALNLRKIHYQIVYSGAIFWDDGKTMEKGGYTFLIDNHIHLALADQFLESIPLAVVRGLVSYLQHHEIAPIKPKDYN